MRALQSRYPTPQLVAGPETDGNKVLAPSASLDRLNRAFVAAARVAVEELPDDANCVWLLAEALMNCRPWQVRV